MKIGLISDIHGNVNALRIALDILQGAGVDHIVCAGDLIDGYKYGNEVVALIRERGIPCVQGNHDADARETQLWALEHHEYLQTVRLGHVLEEETITFLESLPRTLRFEWEGLRVLLTHANPWDQQNYIFPAGRRELFDRISSEAEADVVILGHTHEPMAICHNGVWIFNPASTGLRRLDTPQSCAVLNLPDCRMDLYSIEIGLRLPLEHVLH